MNILKLVGGLILIAASVWGMLISGGEIKLLVGSASVMFIGGGLVLSSLK